MRQRQQSKIGIHNLMTVCFAFLPLVLGQCNRDQGQVYVTDESGGAVEGAVIWVSYVSSAKAYDFRTDAKGWALLELPDFTTIHGISVSKGSQSAIILENIKWPLRVVIREKK